jgi:hypothetical protein
MKHTARYDLQLGVNEVMLPAGAKVHDIGAVREVPRLYFSVPASPPGMGSEEPAPLGLRIEIVGIGAELDDEATFISTILIGGSEYQAWLIP